MVSGALETSDPDGDSVSVNLAAQNGTLEVELGNGVTIKPDTALRDKFDDHP